MEQSPPSPADRHSAGQEIPCLLWNPNVHHCVHKSQHLDTILSQQNPVCSIDPYLLMVHLNVILLPTPRSSQLSLPFGPPNQKPVNTSPLHHACYPSHPPRPPWFNHPNNIRWRIQAVKFVITQFSPWAVFLPLRSINLPQHSVLKNPRSMFLPQSERPSFTLIQHNWQNYSSVYFNL
jgi:hypothetical protein